jgi:Tol biopolymer transport system component
MVADLAGGAPVEVSAGLPAAREPAWAPDGSRLVFEALNEGANDLFLCRPDGSERTNLTRTEPAWEASACFCGPERLACLVGTDRTELWTVGTGTGERTRLALPPAFHARPVASPDGRLLAVVAAERLAGPGQVLLVPVDGGSPRTLLAAAALYSVPAFTPDGQGIVVAFDGAEIGGTRRGLARVPLDGGVPLLLADDGYPLAAVSVAAGGRTVAYTSARAYHDTWVSLVGMDGSDRRRIAASGFHIVGWPGFTPDGQGLVFEGVYAARYTVNLLHLASGKVTPLTPEGDSGAHPVVSPR